MGCSPLLVFVLSINQEEKGLLQPMLNALVPRVNKAILLEWLGVLFFLFYTSWLPRQGLRKRGADDDNTIRRPPVGRCVERT